MFSFVFNQNSIFIYLEHYKAHFWQICIWSTHKLCETPTIFKEWPPPPPPPPPPPTQPPNSEHFTNSYNFLVVVVNIVRKNWPPPQIFFFFFKCTTFMKAVCCYTPMYCFNVALTQCFFCALSLCYLDLKADCSILFAWLFHFICFICFRFLQNACWFCFCNWWCLGIFCWWEFFPFL